MESRSGNCEKRIFSSNLTLFVCPCEVEFIQSVYCWCLSFG